MAFAPIARRVRAADFRDWLAGLRQEALRAGISAATFERAFAGVVPLPEVIERDRRQPERRLSLREYLERVVTAARIETGRRRLLEHRPLLDAVEARYGIPARFIVALWGVESDYGRVRGRFPVIAALATLAFEGRRASFFRRELLAALAILERGDVRPEAMYGSWAGAMGQPQFMPTTFLAHAVDADGDGRRDIWDSLADIFASMARYLSAAGWRPGWTWGRAVQVTGNVPASQRGLDYRAALAVWHRRGVRLSDGGPLPQLAVEASLLMPEGDSGPAFLVYDNFRALMRWNRSTHFAFAVGHLADALADRQA